MAPPRCARRLAGTCRASISERKTTAITCSISITASSAVGSGAPASAPKLELVLTVSNSGGAPVNILPGGISLLISPANQGLRADLDISAGVSKSVPAGGSVSFPFSATIQPPQPLSTVPLPRITKSVARFARTMGAWRSRSPVNINVTTSPGLSFEVPSRAKRIGWSFTTARASRFGTQRQPCSMGLRRTARIELDVRARSAGSLSTRGDRCQSLSRRSELPQWKVRADPDASKRR